MQSGWTTSRCERNRGPGPKTCSVLVGDWTEGLQADIESSGTGQAGGQAVRGTGEKDGRSPLSCSLGDCTALQVPHSVRGPKESIANYVAELRALGQTCGFGDSLDDMLRDRLVCGVNDERVQRRLLSERETRLDFKRALELANMMESADKNSRELQSRASAGTQPQSQKEVYKVTSDTGGCWRCGKQNHKPASCRFKTARCHTVCRKAAEESKGRPPRAVKTVQGQRESSEQSPLNQIQALSERRSQPIIVEVELDGEWN